MTIPRCKYCRIPLLRWGWYFDPEHPVYYWYRLCCDFWEEMLSCGEFTQPLTDYIVVLPEGAKDG